LLDKYVRTALVLPYCPTPKGTIMTDPDTQDATAAELDETAGQDAVEADAEAQDAEAGEADAAE
jgi:hypothetical protein